MTESKIDLFTISTEELIAITSEYSFLKPVSYFFLLALPKIEEKTKGGIILSQQSLDASTVGNNVGRVVGIGPGIGAGKGGAYDDLTELNIGDYVGYNPHVGLPQHHDHNVFIIVADDGIRTRINDISKHTDGIFTTYKVGGIN